MAGQPRGWGWGRAVVYALEQRTLLSGVTFAPQVTYTIGNQPRNVIISDLGNGHPDLIANNYGDQTIDVLKGDGTGTFSLLGSYPDPAGSGFAVADLGDGHPDLIVLDPASEAIDVYRGNGDGTFGATPASYPVGTGVGVNFCVADLGNGHADVIAENDGNMAVLIGNGNGTFQSPVDYPIPDTGASTQLIVADLGNGHPDMVFTDYNTGTYSVRLGNGNGTFGAEQDYSLPGAFGATIGDFGTGHPDLAVSTGLGGTTINVLIGNGDGTFGPPQPYTVGNAPYAVNAANLGDGDTDDLVVSDLSDGTLTVLPDNGDGTFGTAQTLAVGSAPYGQAVGDVNGDGLADLVAVNGNDGTVSVLLNTTPKALAFAAQPASGLFGATLAPVIVDLNGAAGTPLAGNTSDVTLSISNGGTLLGTTTVAAVNGVATFSNLSVSSVGTYTLTATDGTFTPAVSNSFTIALPRLEFGRQPAAVLVDTPLSAVAVDVLDPATGNLVTSGAFDVTLAISNGGTLLGSTSVAAVNGVATFAGLSVPTVGTYTLTATSGADLPVVSAAFTVVSRQLQFSSEPPVIVEAAAALGTLIVDITNPLTGAVLTDDDSTVTLTLTGGTGTLGGTATVAAANGVATFPGVSVLAAGTYRLVATDGTYGQGISTAFTVATPLTPGTSVAKTIGNPDPTFGVGGIAAFAVGFTATTAVAADGSGSVLVGPFGTAAGDAFGLTRYTATGSLDIAFGTAGVTTTAFPGLNATPAAVAVLSDGNIVVAGTATASDGTAQFAVAQYTSAGVLDSSFGSGGIVLVGDDAAGTVLRAMVVGPGGTIYLAGGSGGEFTVAALTAAGALDDAFGGGGIARVGFAGGSAQAAAIALEPDGSLVIAGSVSSGDATIVAVARLLANGAVDPKFGTRGTVVTQAPGGVTYQAATAVIVDAAGRVVVGGLSADGNAAGGVSSDFLLRRYTAAGKLDRTFGYAGTVLTSFAEPTAVTGLVPGVNGTIVASGRDVASLASTLGPQDLVVARFTTTGSLDKTFAGTGATSVNLGGGGLAGAAAAAASAAGTANRAATLRPAPARVVRPAALILRPDAAAALTTAFNQFVASAQGAVAATATGEILATGQAGSQSAEVELVAAGVDLAAAVASFRPASVAANGRGTAVVTITETGTAVAAGSVTVSLAFSPAADGSALDAPAVKVERINLRAGHSRAYRITVAIPGEAGTWYVVATVTGSGTALSTDLDPANNTAVSTSPVSVTPIALGRRR